MQSVAAFSVVSHHDVIFCVHLLSGSTCFLGQIWLHRYVGVVNTTSESLLGLGGNDMFP